ncbi:hypothetical protein DQ04_04061010 [Trypanosoma grayi]|uniref:hypothetical protein n=1 Tax=Trypanosoma grayi TaxID=71804 RepID=UPI0004F4258A|nr:hypothetical protein DQ04_04061010 [Trypanosoma grayi]KEG10191.1 hypothetical protein DQ04_04061010 [Trypanosoma grayi]
MVDLTLDPTKWADAVESSPECLLSAGSARNVETVLSKAMTRRHQKMLLKAVEPFVGKMIEDAAGISILTSLVKYGTVETVNAIAKIVLRCCDKILKGQATPTETCEFPLGTLLERVVYREDCSGEERLSFITALKSLKHPLLMGRPVFLLATARLIIIDMEFAVSICSSPKAQEAFLQISSSPSKKGFVTSFCEVILSGDALKNSELRDLCSSFVFTSISSLYAPNVASRPHKQISMLLASCGSAVVTQDMVKRISVWPDIRARAKNEDYAKIIALLLTQLQDASDGATLVTVIFQSKEDFDEIAASRKTSHLQLLAAIAENPAYVKALTKALGESREKALVAAAVRYRNATMPRALATKESLLQRLKKVRTASETNDNASKKLKRRRQ